MIAISWGVPTPREREIASKPLHPIRACIRRVCHEHGVSFDAVVGPRRDRAIVRVRQEAYWRCREETHASLSAIGKHFGDRDHTTILAGLRTYELREKLTKTAAGVE